MPCQRLSVRNRQVAGSSAVRRLASSGSWASPCSTRPGRAASCARPRQPAPLRVVTRTARACVRQLPRPARRSRRSGHRPARARAPGGARRRRSAPAAQFLNGDPTSIDVHELLPGSRPSDAASGSKPPPSVNVALVSTVFSSNSFSRSREETSMGATCSRGPLRFLLSHSTSVSSLTAIRSAMATGRRRPCRAPADGRRRPPCRTSPWGTTTYVGRVANQGQGFEQPFAGDVLRGRVPADHLRQGVGRVRQVVDRRADIDMGPSTPGSPLDHRRVELVGGDVRDPVSQFVRLVDDDHVVLGEDRHRRRSRRWRAARGW